MMVQPGPAERLDEAYLHCRAIHRRHGRSYYLATRLLPAWKRRHVHALYALTRYTDDILDRPSGAAGASGSAGSASRRLAEWAGHFYAVLDGEAVADDPVLLAARHTTAVFGLERKDFDAFFASMTMDLSVRDYRDYDALLRYMDGSAAVIGTLMLPILLAPEEGGGSEAPADPAVASSARELGLAFQLTNFIRDVAEDLRLGRVYLPAVDMERFGVGRDDLGAASASAAVRQLIAFEIERARAHYRNAAPGVAALPARSRRCVRLAAAVYGAILDRVERADYDVLAGRAVVPRRQRLAAVARELARPA